MNFNGNLAWLLADLLGVAGIALVVILLIRLLREHRSPSATMAWGIAIVLLPYVGIPLFLIFGGRRVTRAKRRKAVLYPAGTSRPGIAPADLPDDPVARETAELLVGAGLPAPQRGNRVEFIDNGEAAFARLMAMIDGARESIAVTTFILGRRTVGRAVVDALAKKAAAGVEVRVLLDALGCFRTRWRFVEPIRRAGGKVGIFMPILPLHRKWSAHLRNHRKSVVVDRRIAMVGGMNLAEEYMGPVPLAERWIDTAAIVEGPAAFEVLRVFDADWYFAVGESPGEDLEVAPPDAAPAGEAVVQVVASGPDAEVIPLHDALMLSMLRSRRRVWIVTPYFVPDESLMRALMLLGRMGREVRIVVPARSNHLVADLARGAFFRDLVGTNVELYAYRPGMLHAKLLVIDDDLALVGSANMDIRSLYLDYEVGTFFYNRDQVQRIAATVEKFIESSKRLTREGDVSENGAVQMLEDICRVFAPVL